MGKGATPPPMDWKGLQTGITDAAAKQTQNNRLNTSNPFASQTFNEDGSVSQQFQGGMGQAATGLQNQIAGMGTPMDWAQFGQVGTGDQARQQATDAAYSSATSRLDPQWAQREEANRSRLMNQGLDPSSEAFRSEMDNFGRQRNDAYNQANFSAIGQGQAAGDSAFRNNLLSQQNNIANALRQRGQAMGELQGLQGFLGNQPQYNQDNTTLQGAMGASQFAQQGHQQQWEEEQAKAAQEAQLAAAGMATAGSVAGAVLPALLSFL